MVMIRKVVLAAATWGLTMRGRNEAPVLAWRLVGSYGDQSRAFYVQDHMNSPPTLEADF